MQTLSIGELAERSGVASQAIRFYEKEKLMPPPRRTDANYRRYPLEAVDRLQFIVHAKQWGFTLQEIRELLMLQDANGDRAQAKRIAGEKLHKVREQITVDYGKVRMEVPFEDVSWLQPIDPHA